MHGEPDLIAIEAKIEKTDRKAGIRRKKFSPTHK